MNRRSALVMLGLSTSPALVPLANAQASVSMIDLAWVFWHEGVRLYDENLPGSIRALTVLRPEWLGKQGQNGAARAAFESTPDDRLIRLLGQVPSFVERDFLVATHFDWTAQHENQLANYRTWVAERKFGLIRSTYAEKQGNPNQHNLLAAMSNGWIQQRVAALR